MSANRGSGNTQRDRDSGSRARHRQPRGAAMSQSPRLPLPLLPLGQRTHSRHALLHLPGDMRSGPLERRSRLMHPYGMEGRRWIGRHGFWPPALLWLPAVIVARAAVRFRPRQGRSAIRNFVRRFWSSGLAGPVRAPWPATGARQPAVLAPALPTCDLGCGDQSVHCDGRCGGDGGPSSLDGMAVTWAARLVAAGAGPAALRIKKGGLGTIRPVKRRRRRLNVLLDRNRGRRMVMGSETRRPMRAGMGCR